MLTTLVDIWPASPPLHPREGPRPTNEGLQIEHEQHVYAAGLLLQLSRGQSDSSATSQPRFPIYHSVGYFDDIQNPPVTSASAFTSATSSSRLPSDPWIDGLLDLWPSSICFLLPFGFGHAGTLKLRVS